MFHGKRVFGGPSFLFKTRGGLVIFPVGYDGGEGSGWMMWSQKRVGWWNTWKPPFRLWWNFDQMHSVSFLISSKHFNFEVGKLFFFQAKTPGSISPQKNINHQGNTLENTHLPCETQVSLPAPGRCTYPSVVEQWGAHELVLTLAPRISGYLKTEVSSSPI